MRFADPHWFILIPLLVLAAFWLPRLRLHTPWRLLLLLLLVCVLANPEVRQRGAGLDLWVIIDRSDSAERSVTAGEAEWRSLLERSRGQNDTIHYVDYSDTAASLSLDSGEVFQGRGDETRTGLALNYVLSRVETDRASRILLFTDGYATESLGDVGRRLAAQDVPLDYRLTEQPTAEDYRVEAVEVPQRIRLGEPFLVQIRFAGAPTEALPYEVYVNDNLLREGSAAISDGQGLLRFSARLTQPGAHRFQVQLPVPDARPGNNRAEAWVEVVAGPRVVLITSYVNDPLAAALQRQGFGVEVVADHSKLDVGRLSGARAVVLNNVPAHRLPSGFLNGLDFFVRVQGGGLLMVGGKQSFGSGGYFKSAIDELLPVSMELRVEHRKLAVAMAIVMDRSGSMGMVVPGGQTKMDLANEGAANAIELLGPQDQVSVIAVDSEPHTIVPMTSVGDSRNEITDHVRRIGSMGGGIYVYRGLEAAWTELQKTKVGQRHIILFSDASDSEEPGAYKQLIKEMRSKENGGLSTGVDTTLSVIALGTDTDVDAALLKDIAGLGGGRAFFTTDASTIPTIFAQETVSVARSSFLEEPVPLKGLPGWLEIAQRAPNWPSSVDGYNLSYARPEATIAAVSGDEYTAPLVAFWSRGTGRAAAVSFPLGGEFSQRVRAWPQYGDFVQTLSRWLMGKELPPGVALRTEVDGLELKLELLYNDSWEQRLAANPPTIAAAHGEGGESETHIWRRQEPGRYEARIPLQADTWLRGAVNLGGEVYPFGPVLAGTNPEWAMDRDRITELARTSAQSGGQQRVFLPEIWDAPRRAAWLSIAPWLLVVALLVLVVDAAWTRLGWGFPIWPWRGWTTAP